jgi:hypothetical protein
MKACPVQAPLQTCKIVTKLHQAAVCEQRKIETAKLQQK